METKAKTTTLTELEEKKAKMLKALYKYRGCLKGKSRFKTYEEWHDWRSNVFSKELEERFKKELNLK